MIVYFLPCSTYLPLLISLLFHSTSPSQSTSTFISSPLNSLQTLPYFGLFSTSTHVFSVGNYSTSTFHWSIWSFMNKTCSGPRRAVRSHSVVCSENSLLIVVIGPILNKELEFIFRSDRSDRTCVYS